MGNSVAGSFIEGLQAANKEQIMREDSARADERLALLKEENERRKITDNNMDVYRAKQMEVMDMNLKVAKSDFKEKYSPANRALRAAQAKAKTQAIADIYGAGVAAGGDAQQVSQLQNEVTELKTAVTDKAAVDEDTKVWSDYTDAVAMGRRITDLKPYNQIVASNKAYQTVVKHPVVFYNENDDSHVAGMRRLAERTLRLGGYDSKKIDPKDYAKITEITQNALTDAARKGYMVSDSVTGEMYSITAPTHLSGTSSRVPKDKVDAAKKTISNISQEAGKHTVAMQEDAEAPGVEPPKLKMYTTSAGRELDPNTAKAQYELIGSPVPAELTKIIEDNKKVVKEQEETYNMQVLDDILLRTVAGTASSEDIARGEQMIADLPTESMKKSYATQLKNAKNAVFVDETMKMPSINTAQQSRLQSIEADAEQNIPGVKDQRKLVRGELNLAEGVNDVVKDIERGVGEGGFVSGFGANYVLGIVAADKQKAAEMYNSLVAKYTKTGKITKQQILNTIGLDTRLGKLVAKYVKATSGAAVSDNERNFLIGILAGAMNGRPDEMMKALITFRDVTMEGVSLDTEGDFLASHRLPATTREVKETVSTFKPYSYYEDVLGKMPTKTTGVVQPQPKPDGNLVPQNLRDRM